MRPVYEQESLVTYIGQMLQHLPPVLQSLRKPPPRKLLSGSRRTVLRCTTHEYWALGRTVGVQALSLVFAGVEASDGLLAWWCLWTDPAHPQDSAPQITRLPPSPDGPRHGTELRSVSREVRDGCDASWVAIPGAPPLLRREDLN